MTKKHFEAFAEELRYSNQDQQTRIAVARVIARVAGRFNPAFDTTRFLKACMQPSDDLEVWQ